MTIEIDGKIATINLPEDCTIITVEADTDKLRAITNKASTYKVNAEHVAEMDTAYLQLLLSLKDTVESSDKEFIISKKSKHFSDIFELYGIEME